MSTQAKDAGDFNLIITAVDAGRHAEATAAFSKAFSLDEGLAAQILKSSPIIFAQKLTRAEVKAITGKLAELSNVGMEFRVTARVAGRVPKINWPIRPQFTAADSGAPGGIAFEWDNNAFVCPSCGETFLFRRLGKLKLAEAPANGSGHAKQVSTKVGAISEEELGLSDEELDVAAPDPVPEHEGAVAGVEGVEPLPGEGESLDLPDAVEEIQLDEAEPAESAPEFAGASVPVADEAPIAAEEPAVEEVVPEGVELYNVFLSKITDRSKQEKVAELISKVKGCSINEARDLTTRLVIPIAKNVAKEQAEEILGQFKKIKIFGRMTKVK